MSSNKFGYILVFLILALASASINVNAKGDKNNKKNILKTTDQIANTYIDINNISTLISNIGFGDYNTNSSLEGTVYPKGSGKTCIFESGFVWGAYVTGDSVPHVGGSTYSSGLQPGPIMADGQPASDPSSDNYRVFRVRPDIYPGGPDIDLTGDAANEGTTPSALRAQYEKDWNEWPAAGTSNDLGAPFTDKNGDGKYEPAIDVPGVPGSDQTVYWVANDENKNKSDALYGTDPSGIEIHGTFWAYAQTGALGNMYFKKYTLINKGYQKYTMDSMFVSWWADVDNGDASNDFVGNDTTLSLTYCYNADAVDNVYSPLPPPVVGADFFQGPIVQGTTSDSAIFNGMVVHGKKNLPMTAAYYFINGDPILVDPTLGGDPQGSVQFYRLMNGLLPLSGEPFVDPITGQPSKFVLTGDPVTHTGWIDGVQFPKGDRRQGMASGPFTMAPGDTQEVVVAEMVAGAITGVDRLSAIGLLKFYDQTAQSAYNNFFNLPTPPKAPQVKVATLDKKIVLNWGGDISAVAATENPVLKGYKFEGYNIYQLPNRAATIADAKRIATYDVADGVLKINDDYFDASSGVVANHVVEFGTDNGVQRFITISTDAFNSGNPLVDGIKYYFAVTAYSYNPDAVPHALENPISIIGGANGIIPQSPDPGVRYSYSAGDTIQSVHTGKSDGQAFALVVDPTVLTGDQYKVTFDSTGGTTTWSLTDVTKNQVVLSKQTNLSGDGNYQITNGMMVKVTGPSTPGMKDWDVPSGTRHFTWAGGAGDFGFEGFEGAIGWAAPSTLFGDGIEPVPASAISNTLLKLAQVSDTASFNPSFPANDENMSFGYRYGRHFANPAAQPQFAPYIVNTAGGYSYQDFNKDVPLSAWNVDNPASPQRLAVGFMENNEAGGLVDGKYWPPFYANASNTDGSGPREWLWIFQAPYNETPNTAYEVESTGNDLPIMWFCTMARRNTDPWSPDATGEDQFMILANHVNSVNDAFTFTATAPTSSDSVAKSDVQHINVFPNPYYGVNSQEINKYARFVTFNHLPDKAKIRIFNLAGILVKVIDHDGTQFERWDLTNQSGFPVGSGLYIAYIDMPSLGTTKILKLAIIQEQQFLDRF